MDIPRYMEMPLPPNSFVLAGYLSVAHSPVFDEEDAEKEAIASYAEKVALSANALTRLVLGNYPIRAYMSEHNRLIYIYGVRQNESLFHIVAELPSDDEAMWLILKFGIRNSTSIKISPESRHALGVA